MVKAKDFFVCTLFALGSLLYPLVGNALDWDSPGVVPVQSISDHRWRNANTGQYINTQGMQSAVSSGTSQVVPNNTSGPAPQGVSNQVSGESAGAGTASGGSTTTPSKKITAKKIAKGAGAAVVGAAGGYMVYDSTKGNEQHNIGDVAGGAVGGAMAGAAASSVIGPLGTAAGVVGGAVVGGTIVGSQLFSETDCLMDPVTKKLTCCNTLFNKGQRQADIGEYMFCADKKGNLMAPGVRQCQQGGSGKKTASWWEGLFKDDAWANECEERLCKDTSELKNGIFVPDEKNFCWRYDCDNGYRKVGKECVPVNPNASNNQNASNTDTDAYDVAIKKIERLISDITAECGNI